VDRHKSPIDFRPFQPRATLERQQALEAQYGRIAIDEVAAALVHLKAAAATMRHNTAARAA